MMMVGGTEYIADIIYQTESSIEKDMRGKAHNDTGGG